MSRRGSCLCGAVSFEVTGQIRRVGSCHCSKCRKVSGTGGNAQIIVPNKAFGWLSGQTATSNFRFETGWGILRCATCGSPVPESHDGARTWIPAGLMDDPIETDIKVHIFCASRADWDRESPDALHFDELPPKSGD